MKQQTGAPLENGDVAQAAHRPFLHGLDLADLDQAIRRAAHSSNPIHRAIVERLRAALSAYAHPSEGGTP